MASAPNDEVRNLLEEVQKELNIDEVRELNPDRDITWGNTNEEGFGFDE